MLLLDGGLLLLDGGLLLLDGGLLVDGGVLVEGGGALTILTSASATSVSPSLANASLLDFIVGAPAVMRTLIFPSKGSL